MISVKQYIILHCCCLLLVATGCRSQPENSQQPATPQQSSPQSSAATTNSTEVAQSVSTRNSNATVEGTTRTFDPCSLITRSEIESVQGEEVKETKSGPGNSTRLAVSQCFYQTATPSKSVSLEVIRRLAGQTGALSPREFWEERFERADRDRERGRGSEKKREADKRDSGAREEEEEEGPPPQRVTDVGDEAFWAGNRIIGALYVLKGNSIIRISIGGIADQGVRLEKTKALARLALKRLKD